MQFNKCCIYFPVRQGVLAILALDALYAFIFAVVSMARQKAFSAAFGSAGMLWFEVILHIAYLILSVLFIVVVIKGLARYTPKLPLAYWIAAGVMGLIQLILLILSGVHRSAAVTQCQEDTAWSLDACSSAMTTCYAFLGLTFAVWTAAHVYFCLVVHAFALKMEGRMRYSALKDQYMREWDERIEMNGGIPRVGSVRSAYSVI